ncbi:hypothetical protein AB834_02260 [PVC group bacterium (ex Bugula neritina AB1)]|nr:hypothetical protein AB834_02260 [PVC group bacterium (ex Bugula neritina AB1)]
MNENKSLLFRCPQCHHDIKRTYSKHLSTINCSTCEKTWKIPEEENLFRRCPFCDCKAFFIQKNIHPKIMIGGLLVAILLVPSTYGLSLPILWLIDLFLNKKIPEILVCYKCRASWGGYLFPKKFKPFQHHIGEKYDS